MGNPTDPAASAVHRPRDENLRLVLSPGQETWIRQQLAMARGLAWASLVFLVLAAGWLTAESLGLIAWGGDVSCFDLPADAPDYRERLAEFQAQGITPCPAAGTENPEFRWRDLRWPISLVALLVAFISPMTLIRNLYLARRYKGYLTDHTAFLRKYHRL